MYRCRLCLKFSRNKVEIFKDDFPKMIELLTGLIVDRYDSFPKISCLDCAKNVKSALTTKKHIIQSHKILLEEFIVKSKKINLTLLKSIRGKQKIQTLPDKQIVCDLDIYKDESDSCVATEAKQVHLNNTTKEQFDSVLNLLSPGSDKEWIPETSASDSVKIKSNNSQKRCKSNLKSCNGIFFVKKGNLSVKNKQSSETIVRMKKKCKEKSVPAKVSCNICNKEVQSHWFEKHMETHSYNPVTCEFCGLVSKSSTALRHHVFYYHKSAADEYVCDQCGRHFRSKYRLSLHNKKEHGGSKDFECTTCGKRFFERMHLKRHIDKTHKNIRPYVCDLCGKSFKSKSHITVHERIHSKVAPYPCHMCGESFKMKLTLRTHLKGIHNVQEEEKVFCNICKRGFASEIALKAHINSRIHDTEKCQYCSEMFTGKYLVNHLKVTHGLDLNNCHEL